MHYVVSQIVGSTGQAMRGLKVEVAMLAVWSVVVTLSRSLSAVILSEIGNPRWLGDLLEIRRWEVPPKHATRVFSAHFATGPDSYLEH
jgi:hypothetical protein